MAERERLTKRERRERARAERRAAEAAAAKQARIARIRNTVVAVAVVAGIAALVVLARPEPATTVELAAADVQAAREAAACAPVDVPLLGSQHLDPSTAPPAEQLYPVLPPSSGPHFGSPLAPTGALDDPIDLRSVVHNLEHGAVALWYEPDTVEARAIEEWVDQRNSAGFASGARGGGAILAAPFPEGIGSSDKPIAFRAWGAAVDCAEFNATAADGFLATNFGTRGRASEGGIAGFPEGVITIVGDLPSEPTGSEAPTPSPTPSPTP